MRHPSLRENLWFLLRGHPKTIWLRIRASMKSGVPVMRARLRVETVQERRARRFRRCAWIACGVVAAILLMAFLLSGCGDSTPPINHLPAPTVPANRPTPEPEPEPEPVVAGLHVSATGPDFIEWVWDPVEGVEKYLIEGYREGTAPPTTEEVNQVNRNWFRLVLSGEGTEPHRFEGPRRGLRWDLYVEPGATWHVRVAVADSDPVVWTEWVAGTAVAGSADPDQYERSTRNRPNDFSGHQIHVVYVVDDDRGDRRFDTSGVIHELIGSIQREVMEPEGIRLRIDTFEGEPDVSFLRIPTGVIDPRLPGPVEADWGRLERLLDDAFAVSHLSSAYAVFFGSYDAGLGTATRGRARGGMAITAVGENKRFSTRGDYPSTGWVALHEILHVLGTVPSCAPNWIPGNHVSGDERDVMQAGTGARHWPPVLDVGRDDYFRHGRTGCLDIAHSPFVDSVR